MYDSYYCLDDDQPSQHVDRQTCAFGKYWRKGRKMAKRWATIMIENGLKTYN